MRLFIIHTGFGLSKEEIDIRTGRMKNVVAADTEITMECLEQTEICIDSQLDVALAAPEIIEKAVKAEKDGYDAVGIYCTSDPGLRACREAVSIPVMGAGLATFATASMLGDTISFITTSSARRSEKVWFARQCGMDMTRLASVRSIEYDILNEQKDENRNGLLERLEKSIDTCKTEDGADVVILGCLSFAGLGYELSRITSVPVVDPAYALVSTMETLVRQNLSHSKRSYPYPPMRVRRWGAGVLGIKNERKEEKKL